MSDTITEIDSEDDDECHECAACGSTGDESGLMCCDSCLADGCTNCMDPDGPCPECGSPVTDAADSEGGGE